MRNKLFRSLDFKLLVVTGRQHQSVLTSAFSSYQVRVTSLHFSWKKNINPRNKLGQRTCTFCALKLTFTTRNVNKKLSDLFVKNSSFFLVVFAWEQNFTVFEIIWLASKLHWPVSYWLRASVSGRSQIKFKMSIRYIKRKWRE